MEELNSDSILNSMSDIININTDLNEQQHFKTSKRIRLDNATENRLTTFIVVIENPKFIENITAIIRSANAFGVSKVYIIDGNKIMPQNNYEQMRNNDKLNGLTVSAIKWTYVKVFNTTTECIDYLNINNFTSIATSPHDKNGSPSIELKDGVYTDKKLALWMGNESHGLSDLSINNSKCCIKLNMYGMVESLNLGSCASIIMYEIATQRRKFSKRAKKSHFESV